MKLKLYNCIRPICYRLYEYCAKNHHDKEWLLDFTSELPFRLTRSAIGRWLSSEIPHGESSFDLWAFEDETGDILDE